MTAHNDEFPWMSYYKNYNFFEDRIRRHSKVRDICMIDGGLYKIELQNGKLLKIFICECYSYDMVEYYETVENLGKVDVVVINSLWCSYTLEAKHYCMGHGIGLFDISGFMAALNREKYWEFLTDYEKESFTKRGWL
jgi:hypothetical protein